MKKIIIKNGADEISIKDITYMDKIVIFYLDDIVAVCQYSGDNWRSFKDSDVIKDRVVHHDTIEDMINCFTEDCEYYVL